MPATFIHRLRTWLEYLGGSREVGPGGRHLSWWLWGIWWTILALIVWMFAGSDSKFIYIDF